MRTTTMHSGTFILALCLSFISLVLAGSRTSPPSGAKVVSKSPGSGQYSSIQAAVNSFSTSSTADQVIFINPGTYAEQVYIASRKARLTIYGYTTDTSSYTSNTVTITHSLGADKAGNNDMSATVRAWSTNLRLYNLNIENTRGQGTQALALSASAGNAGFYGVSLKGYQDTLLAQEGAQVYAKSYIAGATDFIFGQRATAWFHGVDLRLVNGGGWITANGRDSSSNPSFYVLDRCTVAAAAGKSVPAGSVYLGRPWRNYARVVFQSTAMSGIVNPAGWSQWNVGDPRTNKVLFGEFGNTGAGAGGARAPFSTKLSSPVSITTVLGSNYASWVDTSYLN